MTTKIEWADHTVNLTVGCMKCGQRVNEKNFHVDHIIPLAAGGDEWDLNNLELSCPRCNIISVGGNQNFNVQNIVYPYLLSFKRPFVGGKVREPQRLRYFHCMLHLPSP